MGNRNKALIITGVILLVVATIIFLIGGWIAGWDFVAYFKSPAFVWLCVIIGLYVLGVLAIVILDKINRL